MKSYSKEEGRENDKKRIAEIMAAISDEPSEGETEGDEEGSSKHEDSESPEHEAAESEDYEKAEHMTDDDEPKRGKLFGKKMKK